MRDWHFIFLIQCPLMLAFPVVNLLLPGFSDQSLEAGIIKAENATTTYIVHIVETGKSMPHESSMTAIAAPTSFQLISTVNKDRTAFLSCNFGSQTTVSCYASVGTLHVQGTLKPKDINWIPVTITTSYKRQRSTATAISSETDSPAAGSIAMIRRPSFNSEFRPNEDLEKSTRPRFSLSIAYLTVLALKYGDAYLTQILYTAGVAIVLAGYFLF